MKEWVKALYIGYHQALDLPKNLFPFPRTGHLKISLGPTQFLYIYIAHFSYQSVQWRLTAVIYNFDRLPLEPGKQQPPGLGGAPARKTQFRNRGNYEMSYFSLGRLVKDNINCPEKVMKISHFNQTNQRILSILR